MCHSITHEGHLPKLGQGCQCVIQSWRPNTTECPLQLCELLMTFSVISAHPWHAARCVYTFNVALNSWERAVHTKQVLLPALGSDIIPSTQHTHLLTTKTVHITHTDQGVMITSRFRDEMLTLEPRSCR